VQKRAVRLIDSPILTNGLQSLEHRRQVGMLSLFYRYFNGRCSDLLVSLIPLAPVHSRKTRQTLTQTHVHGTFYTVDICHMRTGRFYNSFLCSTARLWNNLLASRFPPSYNMGLFKNQVHSFLSLKRPSTQHP